MDLRQFGAYAESIGIGPALFSQETTVKGADIHEFDKWSFVRTKNPEPVFQETGPNLWPRPVLALKHFGEKAAIPAAIFAFICIITASIMAEVWQRTTLGEGRS